MDRAGIFLAGTAVLDVVHMIAGWPREEQIAFIHETIEAPGGPPHNAAAGLVKLGAPFPVTLRCLVGDDAAGQTFMAKARALGLDPSHILVVPGQPTDVTHVMTSKATGRRTFFVVPGVNDGMTADQVMPPAEDQSRIYYLGSPVISRSMDRSDGWRRALRDARARGYKTAMELCPVPAEDQAREVTPCLPLLDYFVINDSEAEAITGICVADETGLAHGQAEAALDWLLDHGVGELAAIHHPMGAMAKPKRGAAIHAPSVNVPQREIVSAVGAGDAFYAGMLFGLHEGWPLPQCLALANAAAATCLHGPTTSASIRPWRDCLAYAEACGLRSAP